MLNKENGMRELAYVVRVDAIEPIEGKDRVECARVNAWTVMIPKNQFQPGDLGVYFEIDSKVDTNKPEFAFLEKRHGKIKTQKFKAGDGQFWSQGLLMHPSDFGWTLADGGIITDDSGSVYNEGDFLTEKLGVVYSVEEDNKRKGSSPDKYKKMAARHPKLFRNPIIKKIYSTKLGKKILFLFFGKKKDRMKWPEWVSKTDEERVQNLPHIVENKGPWIATEKIDGTSTTFTMKRGKFGKKEFYVCSRNVCFTKERGDKCFYDENYYTKMAKKYNIEEVLSKMLDECPSFEWITLQGETYGAGVQKRDYGLKEQNFAAFNLIDSVTGRWNSSTMADTLLKYGIPSVPILDVYILPDTVEEILEYAGSAPSEIDGGMREGVVFRSTDGTQSFKAVDNAFLLKYHG